MVLKAPWSATAFAARASLSDRGAPASVKGWKRAWRTWLALNATELTWTALLIGLVLFVSLFTAR